MPSTQLGPADTIRILVATDNHVGAHERDAERENDSWRSFEEVLTIAREQDVDMVLLAGDLFHDNKPSRQAMYHVMRVLRSNCLGDKPCELQMVSDKTEAFEGVFDHVNYEDPDINVSLPVFSIHGNHDDPTGTKMLASLDLLQVSGLINYYGRTPESDNIEIKPVLLQKGRTKLALYGMSNVRDERLYRTFRDGKVKFFRPSTQQSDWFNLMSVHQNHHAYTEKGYLPEEFLPSFIDLVVWGHEHECKIDPRFNPEMGFHVMQPGSSIATSLSVGETVSKHVAIVSVVGKRFEVEPVRLKTVRPFVMKEIVLMDDPVTKKLVKKENNRPELMRRLTDLVNQMIKQAKLEWLELQDEGEGLTEDDAPKPLIRLRVEYSAPEGSRFDLENPQRFSNRFQDRIANKDDIVQFHRRKKQSALKSAAPNIPQPAAHDDTTLDHAKVEKLVKQYLEAQSLTILPQNTFGDAVSQFVDKDDRHAMEMFVEEALKSQVGHLLSLGNDDDEDDEDDEQEAALAQELQLNKSRLEELFAKGLIKKRKASRLKPKPDGWDSELDGPWEDQPGAMIFSDLEDGDGVDEEVDENGEPVTKPKAKPKGRGRPAGTKAATTKAAATKKAPAPRKTAAKATTKKATATTSTARGRKKKAQEEEEEEEEEEISDSDDDDNDYAATAAKNGNDEDEDDDVMILDDSSGEDDSQSLFVKQAPAASKGKGQPKKTSTTATATTRSTRTTTPSVPASAPTRRAATATSAATTRARNTQAPATQQQQQQSQQSSIANWARRGGGKSQPQQPKPEEIEEISSDDDDDDAFEPVKPVAGRKR